MAQAVSQLKYNPKKVDINELAMLLVNLSPLQQNKLELLLDEKAMSIVRESDKDIKEGRTIPIEEW